MISYKLRNIKKMWQTWPVERAESDIHLWYKNNFEQSGTLPLNHKTYTVWNNNESDESSMRHIRRRISLRH